MVPGAVRIVVCINGRKPGDGPAAAALDDATLPCTVELLDVASKPAAWNRLRAEPADIHMFADADIAVNEGALPALVAALDAPGAVAATAMQSHLGDGAVARTARVPHHLSWGGLLGTLYAAKTDALPTAMPDVILDDAWLFATLGANHVVQVRGAVAEVKLPTRWRDLWRQRVRAERGKAQLRSLGLPLATPPREASPLRAWKAYPRAEWPYVALLAGIKAAAAGRARFGSPKWDLAESTKR
jgi:hypothetical protein